MKRVLLARHGESELSVREVVNGDPAVACGLTAAGEEQARALGRALAEEPVELAVTSAFERCRRTAELALAGREVRVLEVPELGDVRCGAFEAGHADAYRGWAWRAPADEPAPGGGESRVALARRVAAAAEAVSGQPERTVLVVGHAVTLAYLLGAARGESPRPRIAPVPYATAAELTAAQLRRAAGHLAAWAAAPDW